LAQGLKDTPVDAAIVGVIDNVDVTSPLFVNRETGIVHGKGSSDRFTIHDSRFMIHD